MIKVKAIVELYSKGRKTPFVSGYRPLFNFIKEMKTSGMIELIDRDKFYPGDIAEVRISFLNTDFLGDSFGVGSKFTFTEGINTLGEGVIREIIQ